MSDTTSKQLNAYIRRVWLKKQTLHLSSGALAFVRWGTLLFFAGMLIDWLTFMPSVGRVILFSIMLAGALIMAWRGGWKHLRIFNARNTVLEIEESLGGRESLLVTAVQFGNATAKAGAAEKTLIEHTCNRAEAEVSQLGAERIVTFSGLKRPFVILLILALAVGGFAWGSADFLGAGLTRLLPPWGSVKYPTRTTIALTSSDLVVKEGAEALLQANILGVIPKDAKITLRPATGKPFTRTVPIDDGVFEYEIISAHLSFAYRIVAGDDRSEWQNVTVIAAPRIQKADVTLTYPAYTQRASETLDALTLTVPEGTALNWVLHLDRAVSEARVASSSGEERALSISDDGMQVTMDAAATSSRSYAFTWKEKSKGYLFESPSNYLQVKPDEEPQVELTKPENNIFATLGRNLDFAIRARDDHGIGEASIRYRVNKTEEKGVTIAAPEPDQLGEVPVDWDYATALTNLVVGDTVTFVVEMADRYPGEEGPHRVRSQARRLSLLSEAEYLTRMYKQKVRLLTMVKNIYREERGVHTLVKEFEPASESFIQTCQLEVVRQELIRDRLLEIKQRMSELVEDLAANSFTNELYTGELIRLQSELQRIADDHISRVSSTLKTLSTAAADSSEEKDITGAVDAVNVAARELGIMVLQLGFNEATEVMAREIHTISEDQAYLRWRTIASANKPKAELDDLGERQNDLADWVLRLLGSIPQDRESTEDDALVAFKLSRLSKELMRASTAPNMRKAADSIGQAAAEETAALQAGVIKALLSAEFRLRRGLEYAALVKAESLFADQARAQKELREAIAPMNVETFKQRKADIEGVQQTLSKRLTLLLMPAIPAPRYRLLDATPAPKPAVATFLAESVRVQNSIAQAIEVGDQEKAIAELAKAEQTFTTLATITSKRLGEISEAQRVGETAAAAGSRMSKIAIFTEQLSAILEKTEDAEADETDTAFLVPLLERLAQDLTGFKQGIVKTDERIGASQEGGAPLRAYIDETVRAIKQSARELANKKASEAIEQQERAAESFELMVELLTRQSEDVGAFAAALSMNRIIHEPGDLMQDIQSEQFDMVKTAEATKDDDLPALAMAQKNLVHAVNAVLTYLDPFAHHIETGSVMLFAKEDMGAAAIALEEKDREEALDASSFVAESLQEILDQLSVLAPQYTYVLELVEFTHEGLAESINVHALQKQLSVTCAASTNTVPALSAQQEALLAQSRTNTDLLVGVTGMKQFSENIAFMESALKLLQAGDTAAAAEQMDLAVDALAAVNEELLRLNALLVSVLAPPIAPAVPPEFSFLVDFTSLATHHKVLYRSANMTSPKDAGKLSAEQDKLAKQCEQFVARYAALGAQVMVKEVASLKADFARSRNPTTPLDVALAGEQKRLKAFFAQSTDRLTSAHKLMQQASAQLKAGKVKDAITAQRKAARELRTFYIDNILMFMVVPGPPPPADPAPSYDISLEDDFQMFAPGSVSGRKIKGGKLEWQVLGRRDRAALNENFARELPLEYRGLLKDYYERLAQ
ncbi:MAG: hypothetical protein ACI856_001726 [Kiritimatiellia bacterium]|jgi:hypothetical protein